MPNARHRLALFPSVVATGWFALGAWNAWLTRDEQSLRDALELAERRNAERHTRSLADRQQIKQVVADRVDSVEALRRDVEALKKELAALRAR